MKITHLTSVHPRYDTRIFLKECTSLAKRNEYEVNLIVADSNGNEVRNNVNIYDVGMLQGRVNRMFKTTKKILRKAIELESDIYHFHDPELIPVSLKLKRMGKKVIYDVHEDVPRQVLSKPYLNRFVKLVISYVFEFYENYAAKKFDAIITATPYIRDRFLKVNKNSMNINNFPIIGEFLNETPWVKKKNEVCYVGGLTKVRGIRELVNAMENTEDIKLNLAGVFNKKYIEEEVKGYDGWENVNELGFLSREELTRVLSRSKAGLVTLHPIVNYRDALPVKMFEYMVAGIPVIASDIKLWKEIIEGNKCGICVNPLDPKEISKAIEYVVNNPKEAQAMGENGRKAVEERYNWNMESRKFLDAYKNIERQ